MALVEVNQLRVSFGEKTAVSAASFAIEKGETFSLIGESGCGKSTLLRVLAGLLREWNGHISVLGENLRPDDVLKARFAVTCRWCSVIRGRLCTRTTPLPAPYRSR